MAMATKREVRMATRVVGKDAGDGDGSKVMAMARRGQ
jgi:hypothetical protein